MAVIHVTPENVEKELKQDEGVSLVDFWAPWCGPCQMMAPVFEELSGEYEGKLKFAKINTEDHPELAMPYGIQGIPTLLFMKGGEEVGRIVGFAPKDVLKSKIDEELVKLA